MGSTRDRNTNTTRRQQTSTTRISSDRRHLFEEPYKLVAPQLVGGIAFLFAIYATSTCQYINAKLTYSGFTPNYKNKVGIGLFSRQSPLLHDDTCSWFDQDDFDTLYDVPFIVAISFNTIGTGLGGVNFLLSLLMSCCHTKSQSIGTMATIYILCAICGFLSQIIYLTESCFEESCNLLPDGTTGFFCFHSHCSMGKGSILNLVASSLWIVAAVFMVRLNRIPSRVYVPTGSGCLDLNLDGHHSEDGNLGIDVNPNGDINKDKDVVEDDDDGDDFERNILNETGDTQEMDLDLDHDVHCKKPNSSSQGSVTDSIFSQGNTEAETEDGTITVTDTFTGTWTGTATATGSFPDLLPALEEGRNHESEGLGDSLLRVQVQDIEVDPSRETMFPISPLRYRYDSTLTCSEEHLLSESSQSDEHERETGDTERETEVHILEDDEHSNDYSNKSSDFDDEFSLLEEIDVVPEEEIFPIFPTESDGIDNHDWKRVRVYRDLSQDETELLIPESVQDEAEESESSVPASTAILEHVHSDILAEDKTTVPSDVPQNQGITDKCTDAMSALEESHNNTSAEKKEAMPTSPPTRTRRLQEYNGEEHHSQQGNDQLFFPDTLAENIAFDGDDESKLSQQSSPHSSKEVAEEDIESGDASVHNDGLLHARILPSTTNLKQLLEECIERTQTND